MLKSKKELEYTLGFDYEILEYISNNLDSYHYEYSKVKKDKKGAPKTKNGVISKRTFNPSTKDLKTIQTRINSKILNKLPILPCIVGGVKGNSNIGNAAKHKGKKYVFQTDLSAFFPSVRPSMVFNTFKAKGFSTKNADLLKRLVCYKDMLAQGAPTSPMVSNFVFEKVDYKILELIKGKEITYTRWIDDLTFSSQKCFKNIIPEILKLISTSGFKPSREKTTYREGKSLVTGVIVKNNTLKITDEFRNKDESKMNESQIKGRENYKQQVHRVSNKNVKQREVRKSY